MDVDTKFEEIIQDTLTKMNDVRCSKATFRDALQHLIDEAKIRIEAAQDDGSEGSED